MKTFNLALSIHRKKSEIPGSDNAFGPSQTHTLVGWENLISNMVYNPIGGNSVDMEAETAAYFINGFWYPRHPSQMKYVLSLHVLKDPDAGILELDSKNNFAIYPNPGNDQVTIRSTSGVLKSVKVMDASGRVVMDENNINQTTFQMNVVPLNQGIYYFRIVSDSNTETIPFVKQSR